MLQRVGMASPVCDRCFGCPIERFWLRVSPACGKDGEGVGFACSRGRVFG